MKQDAGTLLYKCKICGKIIDGIHVEKICGKIIDGIHVEKIWEKCFETYTESCGSYEEHTFLLFRTHECEDGSMGVLELVGGRPDGVHKDE